MSLDVRYVTTATLEGKGSRRDFSDMRGTLSVQQKRSLVPGYRLCACGRIQPTSRRTKHLSLLPKEPSCHLKEANSYPSTRILMPRHRLKNDDTKMGVIDFVFRRIHKLELRGLGASLSLPDKCWSDQEPSPPSSSQFMPVAAVIMYGAYLGNKAQIPASSELKRGILPLPGSTAQKLLRDRHRIVAHARG